MPWSVNLFSMMYVAIASPVGGLLVVPRGCCANFALPRPNGQWPGSFRRPRAGDVVLRDARRVARVLGLLAGVDAARGSVGVECRPRGRGGPARLVAKGFATLVRLAGLRRAALGRAGVGRLAFLRRGHRGGLLLG